MPYYKKNADLHFIESVDFEHLLPAGCVAITDAEAITLITPTLAKTQGDQVAALSLSCQSQIYAGFQSLALGSMHTYPAKDKDQANLAASVLASLYPNLPANWTTPFWCMDSAGAWSLVPHTAAQIQQVGQDGKAAILTAITKNATLAAQVMAATSMSTVKAIVWADPAP